MFGFLVSVNQFQSLEESTSPVSQSSVQIEDRLIDPRSTRLARQQAAKRDAEQGSLETLSSGGIFDTVSLVRDVFQAASRRHVRRLNP